MPLGRTATAILLAGAIPLEADPFQTVDFPYQGVTHVHRTMTSPRDLNVHVLTIDLATPGIRFKLTPPGGSRETLLQSTFDFLVQEQAQFAVNVHFYVPFPPTDTAVNLVGFAASEGVVYSPFEPQPVAPGYQDQGYAIVPRATAINIDPWNRVRLLHHDPAFVDGLHFREHEVTLWTAFSGSAQIITDGVVTIPDYSGAPGGLVAENGYGTGTSWYAYHRARCVAGLSRDCATLILFTVDEAGGSLGMSCAEAADLLIRDFGAYNGINLDGDGSTTLAGRDPATGVPAILNHPSDSPSGRKVGSNLALFAPPLRSRPPDLQLSVQDDRSLKARWPAYRGAAILQESDRLTGAAWHAVAEGPVPVDGRLELSIPRMAGTRFYRLQDP
jgi:hypothetical protein